MGPSVRVKRRHAYASIQDDDRYRPEQLHDDQLETALSELGAALPSVASGSLPQPIPTPTRDPHHHPYSPRRDMNRVNRLARRSSVSYRSFATDLDSDLADSPPATNDRRDIPRVSRVRSALSSDSDLDLESEEEDEDHIMEDGEYQHDDDVIDHLDVIGPPRHMFYPALAS
jgi:hypothetical protein